MKLVKMSLIAAMAMGTAAFAVDNIKLNGEAKVWYQTSEYSGSGASATEKGYDFFDKDPNSMAQTALKLGATMDLLPNLSMGASAYAVSTLGLENNLVGATPSTGGSVKDQGWMRELWLAYTMGNTTAKVGRQELNTPLAFTEKWNVVDNTFDAIVLLNSDLPDTTLVGAWVGKHNGVNSGNKTVAEDGKFSSLANGAYAFGAINKSVPNTTLQAWYYDVQHVEDAYWLQADTTQLDKMLDVGVQFARKDPNSGKSTNIWAAKVGVNVLNSTFYAAYSAAGKGENGTNFSNVATDDKSNIYTAQGSIFMDGQHTTRSDTKAWKIGASTKAVPGVTLSTSYGQAKQGDNNGKRGAFNGTAIGNTDAGASRFKLSAFDVIASGKAGPLNLTGIYTRYNQKAIDAAVGSADKKTWDAIRLIAALPF